MNTFLPKTFPSHLLALALALIPSLPQAGEIIPEAKSGNYDKAVILEPNGIDTTFYIPGWLMNIKGTVGVAGIETGVSADIGELLENLDMIAVGGLEVRKGKVGFILEGIYADISADGTTPGPLLSTVSVGLKEVIAEATLTYRFLEGKRGWLEFLAGARYMYLGTDLTLTTDPAGVAMASQNLSAAVFDRATTAARDVIRQRLPDIIAGLPAAAANLSSGDETRLRNWIGNRTDPVRQILRDAIDCGVGSTGPGFGNRVVESRLVRGALDDYVEVKVAAEIEAARGEISAAVAAARATDRAAIERRLARAETRLARLIERSINDLIPKGTVSSTAEWVDPIVGFRGQYDFTDKIYFAGRGDYGGFGVGSQQQWNLFGGFGYKVTQRITTEIGYRYYDVDYTKGSFVFDMATKGAYLGTKIEF